MIQFLVIHLRRQLKRTIQQSELIISSHHNLKGFLRANFLIQGDARIAVSGNGIPQLFVERTLVIESGSHTQSKILIE